MTTIVYDKKTNIICYDSRVSCATDIVCDTYEKKYVSPEGITFFSAGSVADMEAFVRVYEDSSLRADLDMQAIVIEGSTPYLASPDGEGGLNVCPLEYNFAKLILLTILNRLNHHIFVMAPTNLRVHC